MSLTPSVPPIGEERAFGPRPGRVLLYIFHGYDALFWISVGWRLVGAGDVCSGAVLTLRLPRAKGRIRGFINKRRGYERHHSPAG